MEISDKTLSKIANIMSSHTEKFIEEMKDNLESYELGNSRLYDSIGFKVNELGHDILIEISMEDYAKWVDEGRRAGKFPPPNAIRDWIRRKGITYQNRGLTQRNLSLKQQNNTLTYLISRKIAREGIAPRPFIPEFNTDALVEDIEKSVSDDVASDIKAYLIKGLDNLQ